MKQFRIKAIINGVSITGHWMNLKNYTITQIIEMTKNLKNYQLEYRG